MYKRQPLSYAAYGINDYGIINARAWIAPVDGNWELALVGKNLGDAGYWSSATGDDLGSFASTPSTPLSYAIEASYRW